MLAKEYRSIGSGTEVNGDYGLTSVRNRPGKMEIIRIPWQQPTQAQFRSRLLNHSIIWIQSPLYSFQILANMRVRCDLPVSINSRFVP